MQLKLTKFQDGIHREMQACDAENTKINKSFKFLWHVDNRWHNSEKQIFGIVIH